MYHSAYGTDHYKSDGLGGGGVGEKNKKKFMQGKMPRKNIHAEGRSNRDFFRKSEFQKSTILLVRHNIACGNIRFSSLFAAGDVS